MSIQIQEYQNLEITFVLLLCISREVLKEMQFLPGVCSQAKVQIVQFGIRVITCSY